MPVDDLYWNAIDFGSEESLHEVHSKQYVDPWDLENYAYIRDQLDSIDLQSTPSGSSSDFAAGSSGEFAEANSTSFYYVPGNRSRVSVGVNQLPLHSQQQNQQFNDPLQKYDSLLTEQENYVAIDDLKEYERNRIRKELMDSYGNPQEPDYDRRIHQDFDSETDESPYDESITSYHRTEDQYGHLFPSISSMRTPRDRSLSFSYGDYSYYPDSTRNQEIYSKLDEYPMKKDATLPIYDDDRLSRRKPNNFGLSNYGHLKIDYSYSWNNLNKYICN